MNYKIREIKKDEIHLLNNFLYEAIFIPDGVQAPPKSIIEKKDLQIYVSEFGKQPGDYAFVTEINNEIIGAVWVRIIDDYGHLDNDTPSFAISLYKEYRGLGIGTAMMKTMLASLREKGYKKASLSVQKENYAYKMYLTLGFQIVEETNEEYIMIYNL